MRKSAADHAPADHARTTQQASRARLHRSGDARRREAWRAMAQDSRFHSRRVNRATALEPVDFLG